MKRVRPRTSSLLWSCSLFVVFSLQWVVQASRPAFGSAGGRTIHTQQQPLRSGLEQVGSSDGDHLQSDGQELLEGGVQRRQLLSRTCIGTSSPRIGCALQWSLPSCCDSNPNSGGANYDCSPPLLGNCPSGTYPACCSL